MAVLLDIKKTFDHVKHRILLDSLEIIGIRDLALKWFQTYSVNIKLQVEIPYVNYESCLILASYNHVSYNIGGPQGFVLGPVLFLIYIK